MTLSLYKRLQSYAVILLCVVLPLNGRSFMISCWVPYWRCAPAIARVQEHLGIFDQVSPFSYEVGPEGVIKDPFKKNLPLWDILRAE
ncbi:hypothetical protein H0W26_05365, partial [Candidatus Dependentiae bacterium]|nr:hypothetical protein [Candidatus Dependentiae bacterium]